LDCRDRVSSLLAAPLALAVVVLFAAASPAFARSRRQAVTFLYEVAAGLGRRTTDGVLSKVPAGALPPASGRKTGTVGVDAGLKLASRFALMGIWDVTAGGSTGAGSWGTMGIFGVGRVWPTRRIRIEGGGGLRQLGYQPPSQISVMVTRFWARGAEVAGGVAVFQGSQVAISVFTRYSTATFNGFTERNLSVQIGLLGMLERH
jgi:hypothetical protein